MRSILPFLFNGISSSCTAVFGCIKGGRTFFQRSQQGGFLTAARVKQVESLAFGIKRAAGTGHSVAAHSGSFNFAKLYAVSHVLDLEIRRPI